MTSADAELLQSLVKFLDEFAKRNRADLQGETSQVQRRVGDVRQRLGQFDEAEAAYREALDNSRAMWQTHPHDIQLAVVQAELLNELGGVLAKRGASTRRSTRTWTPSTSSTISRTKSCKPKKLASSWPAR